MSPKKQQVLFIGRKIWSGGAEKVMHYLSHQLDKNLFEPHVAYMIRQDDAPVSYDPSIPIYCVDPNPVSTETITPPQQKTKVSRYILDKLPQTLKNKIKSVIRKKTAEIQMRINQVDPVFPER